MDPEGTITEGSILLLLEKHTYGGDSIGWLPDHRAVLVPFALPGEQVRVRLHEQKRGVLRAELLEVIQPSPDRIPARCPHFGICGGCHYQHLPYPAQLQVKTRILADQLTRLGRIPDPPIRPMQASPDPWNYRNQVQFHVHPDGKLGYRLPGTNRVMPIRECHLPASPIANFWLQLDVDPAAGIERLGLRLGLDDELLLVLEYDRPYPPELDILAGISVVHLYEQESLVLAGDDHILIEIRLDTPSGQNLSHTFHVSAASFFQVNTPMAAAMVRHLLACLPEEIDTLLDVYCGVGLFSAFLAPRTRRLIGIEISPSACEDFSLNLDEFDHVELYEATAEQTLPSLQVQPQVILVDPPRSGLERVVLEAILAMQPEILAYVSCDPATLARDTSRLIAGGYLLQEVTPFDLFPQTFHIESISLFTR